VVLAGVGSILGAAYLLGGRDLVDIAFASWRRWNPLWMMLSVLAFYLIAHEITQTQWFRRFGIEMVPERLQGLVLASVLGSFCLVVPFRNAWTNYWLLRDGREVRAVVIDFRDHGTVGYCYRVNGNEYTASGYPYNFPSAGPSESITAYYSASHPSVSETRHPVSIIDGAWPAIVLFTWPFEFMAIATLISPRCKWAYRFGSRNVLPPAMRRTE
jgi:hypothetical protein